MAESVEASAEALDLIDELERRLASMTFTDPAWEGPASLAEPARKPLGSLRALVRAWESHRARVVAPEPPSG